MKQPRIHISWYILADIFICVFTWGFFYFLRSRIHNYDFSMPAGFYLGLFLYTLGWLTLYFMSGTYNSLYLKSRFVEFLTTTATTLIGSLGLLFFFILKNPKIDNKYYYLEFFSLLIPVFLCTVFIRMIFLGIVKNQLRTKSVYFNAALVGSGNKSAKLYEDFLRANDNTGYRITTFVNTNGQTSSLLPASMQQYQGLQNLSEIIDKEKIEEVIIVVEKSDRDLITTILRNLSDKEVNIKITPDTVDIISGALQTGNVLGVPLIDIHSGLLPSWQQNLKRFIDLFVSSVSIVLLSPLILYSIMRQILSSKGPVFFVQERIGYKGKPFMMYKLRSMYVEAEKNGPQLSSEDDPRITQWGKVMRKWRLDELPQLWNILKGEMSLVGPRPERKFYIDQLVAHNPEYKYLFKVKP
ncbi:MAG: exopolysaccharide biosynthesis polyprenyl glycosylphosphotransferase, partial [Gloeobacteraceae cyanobacterium ES-bin-316]|nr:exopolysaccharide biosynthesis polyprenyl glycosylphosphotransferase [Ferruginibacter sp.]